MKMFKKLFENPGKRLHAIIRTIASILLVIVAVVGVIGAIVGWAGGSFLAGLGTLLGAAISCVLIWFSFLMTMALLDAMMDIKILRYTVEDLKTKLADKE